MSGGRFISDANMGRCGCCAKANQFCDFLLFTPIQKYALYESGQIKLDSEFYDTRYVLPYPFVYDYSFFSDVGTSTCTGAFKPEVTGIYYNLCSCNATYYPNSLTINQSGQIANIIKDDFNYIGYSYKKYNSPYRSTCASVRSDYDRRVYGTLYNNNYINNDGISIINFTPAFESLSRIMSYTDSGGFHSSGNPNPDETIDKKYYLYIQNAPYAVAQFIRASGEQKNRFLGNQDIINAAMTICNEKAYSSASAYIEPKESALPWENGCSLQMSGGYFTSDIEFLNPINANLAKITSLNGIREADVLKLSYPLYYKVTPPDDPPEVTLEPKTVSVAAGSTVYSSANAIPQGNFDLSGNIYCNIQRISNKALDISKKFESFKFEKSYGTKLGINSKYYKNLILDNLLAEEVEFTYTVDAPNLEDFNNLLYYNNGFPASQIFKSIIPIGYSFKVKFNVGFNMVSSAGTDLARSFLVIKNGTSASNSPVYFDSCGNQHSTATTKKPFTGGAFCNNFGVSIDPDIEEFNQNIKLPLNYECYIKNYTPGSINRIIANPDINLNDGNLYAYYSVVFDMGRRLYPEIYANPYPDLPPFDPVVLCFPQPQGVTSYSQIGSWSAMVNLVITGQPTGYDWLDPYVFYKKGRCYAKDGKCINSPCPDIAQPPRANTFVYDSAICYGNLNIGIGLS